MIGNSNWLRDNRKLYARFFFKFAKLFVRVLSARLCCKHNIFIQQIMKVGIFETEHYEGTYPVIRLFDTPSNKLVIFTTPETYQRFADLFKEETSRYEWVILD